MKLSELGRQKLERQNKANSRSEAKLCSDLLKPFNADLKENEAHSARTESTHKGDN